MWDILAHTYANPSRTHIQQLQNQFRHINKGILSITDYIQQVKRIINELALLGQHIPHEDIVDRVLDGLGPNSEYKIVVDAIKNSD